MLPGACLKVAAECGGHWAFSRICLLEKRGRPYWIGVHWGLSFFHRSKLTSIYLLFLTKFKILMNVEEKLENQYWACQSLAIFQLRMFEFRLTLMPVECSINSVKIPLSSWVVITKQLSEKNQGRKACSDALFNWLVSTIICFINLFSLLSCQCVLEESIL